MTAQQQVGDNVTVLSNGDIVLEVPVVDLDAGEIEMTDVTLSLDEAQRIGSELLHAVHAARTAQGWRRS